MTGNLDLRNRRQIGLTGLPVMAASQCLNLLDKDFHVDGKPGALHRFNRANQTR